MSARTLLVLGGARSGKSRYAQDWAEALPGRHVFVATAQAFDDEMAARIARHRDDRDARWTTIEAPLALAEAIRAHAAGDAVVLVDCLTLWATNLLLAEAEVSEAAIERAADTLADAIGAAPGRIVLVSNEVGLGIVPDNPLARRFRDVAGRINQRVAACVESVVFLAAGLPLTLK